MIQIPLQVGTVLLVLDVLGMSIGALAAIQEAGPRERGRHRAR